MDRIDKPTLQKGDLVCPARPRGGGEPKITSEGFD